MCRVDALARAAYGTSGHLARLSISWHGTIQTLMIWSAYTNATVTIPVVRARVRAFNGREVTRLGAIAQWTRCSFFRFHFGFLLGFLLGSFRSGSGWCYHLRLGCCGGYSSGGGSGGYCDITRITFPPIVTTTFAAADAQNRRVTVAMIATVVDTKWCGAIRTSPTVLAGARQRAGVALATVRTEARTALATRRTGPARQA